MFLKIKSLEILKQLVCKYSDKNDTLHLVANISLSISCKIKTKDLTLRSGDIPTNEQIVRWDHC